MRSRDSEHLADLQKQIKNCRLCQDEFGYEPRPVIQGNHNAKIVQIGQAPSKAVHETGKPFYDASGKKLREEWYQITEDEFYDPDNFYILSMAHCFPGKSKSGGDQRPPKICARMWLKKEMDLVDNEIYIVIGGIAAKFFFPNEKITSLAFENKKINGKPAFIMPHPSPLNVKWFKDNPRFEHKRILEIRQIIHDTIGRF
jgi:uracil-DNA glycosylase family 4